MARKKNRKQSKKSIKKTRFQRLTNSTQVSIWFLNYTARNFLNGLSNPKYLAKEMIAILIIASVIIWLSPAIDLIATPYSYVLFLILIVLFVYLQFYSKNKK